MYSADVSGSKTFTNCNSNKLCHVDKTTNPSNQKLIAKKALIVRKCTEDPSDTIKSIQFCCPNGDRTCNSKLSSQHELLTHLQKIHKTTVTQYYCAFGERINVKFCDKSIVALVIPKHNSCEYFFVVKMKCHPMHHDQN